MKSSVDEMLARARAAAKAGEPRRGRQILREILARFPSNPRARAALSELDALVARGGVPMEAIATLTRLQAQGRHAEVLASREVLVGGSAGSPAIFNLVGISQATLGQLDAAAASFDRARAADPEYFDAWNNLGNAWLALGRSEAAAAAYAEASKLRPENADAHANLAMVFLDLGRHAEALQSSERATSLDPSHVEAHASRAAALLGLGRPPPRRPRQHRPGACPATGSCARALAAGRGAARCRSLDRRACRA
jgi:protein O-GlcNAc transferase